MSATGGFANAGSRQSWILKTRRRIQWTTHTIKGPRRVTRFEKWRGVRYLPTASEAMAEMEAAKKRDSLAGWAVFHCGKRLSNEALRACAAKELAERGTP